jgi:beta-N-acetylhexosaminidase
LIDQEGGTVARLKSPSFHEFPSARLFGELAEKDVKAACELVRLNARLMAEQLRALGVTINCAPVCDVPSPDCHGFLATHRTYSQQAELVSLMADAVCDGLLAGGITPVIKHIPGHGRGKVDSHYGLPEVDASLADLQKVDFVPFKDIAGQKYADGVWAMAAHVLYRALDEQNPASTSAKIVDGFIRHPNMISFEGVLIADDISMKALNGTPTEMVDATLGAGMDLTMLCNGSFEARKEALAAAKPLSADALLRLNKAEDIRQNYQRTPVSFDQDYARIQSLANNRKIA